MPVTVTQQTHARTLVEAYIGGSITLADRRSVVRLPIHSSYLELPYSPVTRVLKLEFGPHVFGPDETEHNLWSVRCPYERFPHLEPITIDYQTGWATGHEPDAITGAVEMAANWLATNPETGITRVTLGDSTVQRGETVDLPHPIKMMLWEWRRPRA